MAGEQFFTNYAMLCHNCCQTAVVRLKGFPGKFHPLKQEAEVLEVIPVSCGVCLELPHVHDPLAALFSKSVDLQNYASVIESLGNTFHCTPRIEQAKRFSFKDLRMQNCSMIREITSILDVEEIPSSSIMILKGGCEIINDCKFFRHEARLTNRRTLRYPLSLAHDGVDMPFASVACRPSVLVSVILPPEFCSEDVLAAYSVRAAEEIESLP